MLFTKKLRDRVRNGEITCSVRIWLKPRVRVGGRYRLDPGFVVVPPRAMERCSLDDAKALALCGDREALVETHERETGGIVLRNEERGS